MFRVYYEMEFLPSREQRTLQKINETETALLVLILNFEQELKQV